jgi:hypothetical protein
MTGGSYIDYDALSLEAMRGVVRTVLAQTAKSGLPGEHHFYISFDTEAPGVTLSKRLKERYPREMTIVLQHRFWDLAVNEDRFEVKLTFDSIPERLVVPFAAIKVFFDPSVQYGLRFEDGGAPGDAAEPGQIPSGAGEAGPRSIASRSAPKRPRAAKKPKTDRDAIVTVAPSAVPGVSNGVNPARPPQVAPIATATATPAAPEHASADDAANGAGKPAGAQILSLDQFRKK